MKIRVTQLALLLVTLLVGSGFLVLFRSLLKDVEAQSLQATEEIMVDTSYRLAAILEHTLETPQQLTPSLCRATFPYMDNSRLDYPIQIYRLTKREIGLQFYITDAQGIVLFDSLSGTHEGKNYSQFNDVYLTLRGNYGARSSRRRESDELSSILYVSAPVRHRETIIGVVTTYKAQQDLFPFISARKQDIWQSCLMIGMGITLLVGAVFFWVYRPIGRLTEYAQAITHGKRPTYPKLGSGREINTLGHALKTMRSTLEGREYAKNYVQTLSHELKSPIAAIKASAEILNEDMPPAQKQKFLHTITEQVDRSDRIISRLLQLSRIEQLSELERIEPVAIDGLIQTLCKELHPLAEQLQTTLSPTIAPCTVTGDAFLLRAVFQNLIENAIKYAQADTTINISCSSSDATLTIDISNEGIALPDYARERIFERFYALPQQGQPKSSGVGLALVVEALELHHGTITYHWIEPRHIFKVTLPYEE